MSDAPLFVGDLPDAYDRWLAPTVFAPWAEHVADLIAAERPSPVLELAAGTGAGTLALVAALPDAEIVATDLSAEMLARASARVHGPTFEAVDAQHLSYADDSFDAAVMLFGIMFVPDKVRAYSELRRVLRPGAPAVLTSWGEAGSSAHHAPIDAAVRVVFPDDPPVTSTRVPNSYHDADVIRADLEAGGFTDVDVRRVRLSGRATADGLAQGFGLGTPLAVTARERGIDPAVLAQELRRTFTAEFGTDEVDLSMTALVTVAR